MVARENKEHGFTLIELAIVIIISGLLFIPLFRIYDNFLKVKQLSDTRLNINLSSEQVSLFNTLNGRYPCPADPTLAVGDAGYGREFVADCDPAGVIAAGLSVAGDCTNTAGPGTGVCLVAGSRDTDADADVVNDLVFIGSVPILDLMDVSGLLTGVRSSLDAWNSKLTYATSQYLTQSSSYKFFRGVISAQDEFGNDTAGIQDDAHYVIISHGKDRKGAYSEDGGLFSPCTAGITDSENCDGDSTFVSSIGFYKANGAQYYDDMVFFAKSTASSIWVNYDNPATGATENDVRNLNISNVGIGTNVPATKLEVLGPIRADSSLVSEFVCEADGSFCFPIHVIDDSGWIQCSTSQVLVGIGESEEICEVPGFPAIASIPDIDCSPGWIQGITTGGDVLCSP